MTSSIVSILSDGFPASHAAARSDCPPGKSSAKSGCFLFKRAESARPAGAAKAGERRPAEYCAGWPTW